MGLGGANRLNRKRGSAIAWGVNVDDLRARLVAHESTDALEAEHRRRMLALLEVDGDPCARDHFVPGHFTASAFVLSPDQSALLLIYHGKLHLWLQPGGHVDRADADIFSAARREVAEETGLDALVQVGAGLFDVDVHGIPANPKKGEPAHEHFDVRVLLRSETNDLNPGSDALAARWVPLEAFGTDSLPTDESVMRAVRKLGTVDQTTRGRPRQGA